MSAMRLVAAINAGLDADLSVRALFDAPTVAQLAPHIGGERVGVSRWWPVERPAVVPLSFAQSRLWFLDQLQGPSPVYNMAVALRLRGSWMPTRWRGAGRCGGPPRSLRTLFPAPEGIPQQLVLPPSGPTSAGMSSMPPDGRQARLDEAIERRGASHV